MFATYSAFKMHQQGVNFRTSMVNSCFIYLLIQLSTVAILDDLSIPLKPLINRGLHIKLDENQPSILMLSKDING